MDPSNNWKNSVKALAANLGVPAHPLIEEHEERAWARHCGGQSIDDANAAAYEDIRSRLATSPLGDV